MYKRKSDSSSIIFMASFKKRKLVSPITIVILFAGTQVITDDEVGVGPRSPHSVQADVSRSEMETQLEMFDTQVTTKDRNWGRATYYT